MHGGGNPSHTNLALEYGKKFKRDVASLDDQDDLVGMHDVQV